MMRVAIVGAESTGKTSLAEALADHYRTTWVPEFGRLYTEARRMRGEPWHSDEFTFIAQEQARMEDMLATIANRVLVCDTDPLATSIWHERYLGVPADGALAVAATRTYHLYVITDVDTPFVQDEIRDGESIREWMHERFLVEVGRTKTPMLLVTGSPEARLQASVARIDALLANVSPSAT